MENKELKLYTKDDKFGIKSFKMFEIVQQTAYGITPEIIDEFVKTSWIDEWYYILQDKDVNTEPHYHVGIKCVDSVPTFAILNKFNKIAGFNCIAFNTLEKIKGYWEDAVSYATHRNAPDKYQYDDSEVHCNFDLAKKHEEADNRKSAIKDPVLRSYISLIDTGVLTRYNIDDFVPMEHFVAYNHKLNKAFEYQENKFKRNLKSRDSLKVYYIFGSSGSGKTTLAKYICETMGLEYALSSASNDILQDYNGEPALILDEIRPGSIRFTDLLKLLDHNTVTTGSARYKNPFMNVKLIVMTSILSIDDFYKKIHDDNGEPVKQLHRRIDALLEVNDKVVSVSVYDETKNSYEFQCYFTNEIAKRFTAPQSFDKKYDVLCTVIDALAKSGNEPEKLTLNDYLFKYDDPLLSDNPFK